MSSVEDREELDRWNEDVHEFCGKGGAYTLLPEADIFGAIWGNYPQWEDKIKKAFDPNYVSAPE
jgi:hypothetical protein